MRRLFFLLLATLSVATSHAQSCKVEVIMLKSKVEANPDSVLYSLGDAIALYPQCISELLEAAIIGAKPDADTLTQIIKLAVSEYPSEAGAIAEAAVLASPENVDVIREAFIPEEKPIVATPVLPEPEKRSPIENFLNNFDTPPAEVATEVGIDSEPKEIVMTSKPYDPEDVASTALRAIDELLVKLKNKDIGGVDEVDGAASVAVEKLIRPAQVEKFRLNIPDQTIAISTINDGAHHDMIDERIDNPTNEPLVIQDAVSDSDLMGFIEKITSGSDSKFSDKKSSVSEKPVAYTSSVYPIPSFESDLQRPSIRSISVSPTLPRPKQ